MRNILICVPLLLSLTVLGKEPSGPESLALATARAGLEAMLETDQSHRGEMIELEKQHGKDSSRLKEAWAKQNAIDAQNIRRLEEIIAQHGWPGTSQFGGKAATAAFLILQHSDISYQKKYLPSAREAVQRGEMAGPSLALLEDRVRVRDGQKQLYGSQVTKNSADEWEPLPLEDESKVDALRASVGLPRMSEYLQGFVNRGGGRVSPKWTDAGEGKSNEPSEQTFITVMSATPATHHPTGPTNGFPNFDRDHTITLSAGQSVILASGQKAKVPYGTAVREAGGGAAVLKGHNNTVTATGGVIVSVPVDAIGPADNTVIAN